MVWSPFAKKQANRQAAPSPIETIEAMRRRAKQRLIGAATLVLVGLVGFPLLFETQPRPVSVDIAIEIPDKAKSKPLAMPEMPVAAPALASSNAAPTAPSLAKSAAVVAATAAVAAAASLSGKEEIISSKNEEKTANVSVKTSSPAIKSEVKVAEAKTLPKPDAKPEIKAIAKTEPKPVATLAPAAAPAPVAKPDDGARAKALLDGKPVDKPADNASDAKERFIVQVGAFADASKAREVRLKVERAGLTTYTHVAQTKDGERTRVRVGPLASRAEAEKVANKIKALDLPAAILTL